MKSKLPSFARTMLDTPERAYAFGVFIENNRIKKTAFEQALWWTKKTGPMGRFYYNFYTFLFFEGPKGLLDGLSFCYFGDVLYWGRPISKTPFARFVGNRR